MKYIYVWFSRKKMMRSDKRISYVDFSLSVRNYELINFHQKTSIEAAISICKPISYHSYNQNFHKEISMVFPPTHAWKF
jgi:hypothetical protein